MFGTIGAAGDCLKTAVQYSLSRDVFDKPLAGHQLTRAVIAARGGTLEPTLFCGDCPLVNSGPECTDESRLVSDLKVLALWTSSAGASRASAAEERQSGGFGVPRRSRRLLTTAG